MLDQVHSEEIIAYGNMRRAGRVGIASQRDRSSTAWTLSLAHVCIEKRGTNQESNVLIFSLPGDQMTHSALGVSYSKKDVVVMA